ncbi:MAG TPA: DUF1508 domain-containing protein [Arsenicitalea sp.]|nr:DUF1508 domain-containing protein [Arsenicitalea sp.]
MVAGKTDGFFVRFRARNGEVMANSENYTVKKSALGAIASVQKNGPAAAIVDETIAAPAKPAARKPAAVAAQ